jgi:hypothetical protein
MCLQAMLGLAPPEALGPISFAQEAAEQVPPR